MASTPGAQGPSLLVPPQEVSQPPPPWQPTTEKALALLDEPATSHSHLGNEAASLCPLCPLCPGQLLALPAASTTPRAQGTGLTHTHPSDF